MNGNGLAYSMINWVKYENYFFTNEFLLLAAKTFNVTTTAEQSFASAASREKLQVLQQICPKFNTIKSKA